MKEKKNLALRTRVGNPVCHSEKYWQANVQVQVQLHANVTPLPPLPLTYSKDEARNGVLATCPQLLRH